MKERLRALWHAFSTFSDREGRRVLLLVPLLAALSLLFLWLDEPRFAKGFTQYADFPSDPSRSVGEKGGAVVRDGAFRSDETSGPALRKGAAAETSSAPARSARPEGAEPFFFDPNTVTGEELERLGFTPKQAAAILRYRAAGAVFRRAEDFARCYTVSERNYRRLEPYIRIAPGYVRKDGAERAQEVRPKAGNRPEEAFVPALRESAVTETSSAPARSARPEDAEPFFFDPNTVTGEELERLGFTPKQAAAILRYRSAGAVFRRAEDFARCYTVSERNYRRLEPYIRIAPGYIRKDAADSENGTIPENASAKVAEEGAAGASSGASDREESFAKPSEKTSLPVELNGADSATLTTLRGIGPLTAGRIVRYRERLGGYVAVEQLREIEGMTDRNFSLISQQIRVESSKIRKIDINFAHPSAMKGHPYLTDRMLNRILKYRQLKGGWRSIEDLTERHILTTDEADRLGPYLCFETK